jgi:hypothetical protein
MRMRSRTIVLELEEGLLDLLLGTGHPPPARAVRAWALISDSLAWRTIFSVRLYAWATAPWRRC